ncbi:unnamed protein product, partial [Prorocentrum cordatum]
MRVGELLPLLRQSRQLADPAVCAATIGALSRHSAWHEALGLFAELPGRSVLPDTEICAAAAQACERSGSWQRATRLLSGLPRMSVAPNVATFRSTVACCELAGEWQWALEVLRLLEDRGFTDSSVRASASRACRRGGRPDVAGALELSTPPSRPLRRPQPNYRAVPVAYSGSEEAETDVPRDAGSFDAGGGLARDRRPAVQAGRSQSVKEYTIIVGVLGSRGLWQSALAVLTTMHFRPGPTGERLVPDVPAYTEAMVACRRAGQWQHSLQLLRDMERAGLEPDAQACNVAVLACIKSGQWQRALHLLSDMGPLAVDKVSYNLAMSACREGEQWEMVLQLLKELQAAVASGLEVDANVGREIGSPSSDLYRLTRLGLLACMDGKHWRGAFQLLADMRGSREAPGVGFYDIAVDACRCSGHWRAALKLVLDAEQRGLLLEASAYLGAAGACAAGGRGAWRHALLLLDGVSQRPGLVDRCSLEKVREGVRAGGCPPRAAQAVEALLATIEAHSLALADRLALAGGASELEFVLMRTLEGPLRAVGWGVGARPRTRAHPEAAARALLEGGVAPDQGTQQGWVPLHTAVQAGSEGAIRALLDNRADINTKNQDSVSALHLAVQVRSPAMVSLLLGYGARVDIELRRGATPMHTACQAGSAEIIGMLLDHG